MDKAIHITITHLRNLHQHLEQVINLQEIESGFSTKHREARESTANLPMGPGLTLKDTWDLAKGDADALPRFENYCADLQGVKACIKRLEDFETQIFFFHLAGLIGQLSTQFRELLDDTKHKLELLRDSMFVLCELQKIRKSIKDQIAELEG